MNVRRAMLTIFTGFFSLLAGHVSGQGYEIGVTIRGLSGDSLILGEYFTNRMIPKDTIVLDRAGSGTFRGETPLTGGLYLIYFNPQYYFDLLVGDDQQLMVSADTANLAGSVTFRGSENNRVFQEYKKHLQSKREELRMLMSNLTPGSSAEDSARIMEEQKQINVEMEAYMDQVEAEYEGLLVSDFIGATREPMPPEELLTGNRRHDDSVRFFYYKNHYFDRFDPFDVRLLHTPIYENKIKNYLSRAVPQHPDSLIAAADFLLQGAREEPDLYRYLLITLFNHFAESKYMGMDKVYFHIAEQYYIPDATWSSPEFISKLKENLENNKPTLIGEKAPNLIMRRIPPEHFQMAMQDTTIKKDPHIGEDFFIHDLEAPYTILYFWEADCGHCQKATPALYDVYTRLRDTGVEVISAHVINTIEGKEMWVDFVNEHRMYDWINSWSPYSNEFRKLYNLQSYPQLFILDSEKKIVAKRVTPEQAEQIIKNLLETDS